VFFHLLAEFCYFLVDLWQGFGIAFCQFLQPGTEAMGDQIDAIQQFALQTGQPLILISKDLISSTLSGDLSFNLLLQLFLQNFLAALRRILAQRDRLIH
jgi:hypothetical protein